MKISTESTCTAEQYRQMASSLNSSTHSSHSTMTAPPAARAMRARRMSRDVERHAHGFWNARVTTKNARPSTARGMPNCLEYELVVTFRQLIVPLSEHARFLALV